MMKVQIRKTVLVSACVSYVALNGSQAKAETPLKRVQPRIRMKNQGVELSQLATSIRVQMLAWEEEEIQNTREINEDDLDLAEVNQDKTGPVVQGKFAPLDSDFISDFIDPDSLLLPAPIAEYEVELQFEMDDEDDLVPLELDSTDLEIFTV